METASYADQVSLTVGVVFATGFGFRPHRGFFTSYMLTPVIRKPTLERAPDIKPLLENCRHSAPPRQPVALKWPMRSSCRRCAQPPARAPVAELSVLNRSVQIYPPTSSCGQGVQSLAWCPLAPFRPGYK